jgi:hypothetical protein
MLEHIIFRKGILQTPDRNSAPLAAEAGKSALSPSANRPDAADAAPYASARESSLGLIFRES